MIERMPHTGLQNQQIKEQETGEKTQILITAFSPPFSAIDQSSEKYPLHNHCSLRRLSQARPILVICESGLVGAQPIRAAVITLLGTLSPATT